VAIIGIRKIAKKNLLTQYLNFSTLAKKTISGQLSAIHFPCSKKICENLCLKPYFLCLLLTHLTFGLISLRGTGRDGHGKALAGMVMLKDTRPEAGADEFVKQVQPKSTCRGNCGGRVVCVEKWSWGWMLDVSVFALLFRGN
jgi:hypothetical protein